VAFHGGAQPHSLLDAHLNAGVEKGLDEQLAGVADDRELQADNAGDGIRPEGAQNAVLIPVLLRRERGSGLVDGVFPSSRSFDEGDGGDIEEEKRLLYVAVTRAKEELFMSYYTKKGVNERSKAALCRFLDRANVQKTFEARTVKPSTRTSR